MYGDYHIHVKVPKGAYSDCECIIQPQPKVLFKQLPIALV